MISGGQGVLDRLVVCSYCIKEHCDLSIWLTSTHMYLCLSRIMKS